MRFRFYSFLLTSISVVGLAQAQGQPQGGWRRATPQDVQQAQQQPPPPPVEGLPAEDDPQGTPAPPPPQGPPQAPADGWRKFGDNRGMDNRSMDNRGMPQQQQMAAPLPEQLTLPAGAWMTVRVNQELSTDHNQPGDTFTATLSQPLVANGYVIARRGQTVLGRVSEVQKAGHVKGVSRLGIELTGVAVADGQQVPIRTQLVQRQGDTSHGNDAAAIGTTTAVGAAIGAAVDGGFGAGMGAIGGAVVSTIGVLATRGHSTVIYPEMLLTFRIESPVSVSTVGREMAYQPVRQEDYDTQHSLRPRQPARPAGPYYGGGYGYSGGYGYGYGYYSPVYSPFYYGPTFWGSSFYYRSGPRGYGRYGRR